MAMYYTGNRLNLGAMRTAFDSRGTGLYFAPQSVMQDNIYTTMPVDQRPLAGYPERPSPDGTMRPIGAYPERPSPDGTMRPLAGYPERPSPGMPNQITPYVPTTGVMQPVQSGGGRDYYSTRFGGSTQTPIEEIMAAQAGDVSQTGLHYTSADLAAAQAGDPTIGTKYGRTDLDAYLPSTPSWSGSLGIWGLPGFIQNIIANKYRGQQNINRIKSSDLYKDYQAGNVSPQVRRLIQQRIAQQQAASQRGIPHRSIRKWVGRNQGLLQNILGRRFGYLS